MIQNSNMTSTDVNFQDAGKETVFQTLAGIKKKKNWVSNQMGTWGCVCECVSMCMRVNVCVSFSLKTMPHVSPALGQSCWREGRLHSGAGSWSSPLSLDIAWEAWGATEASLSRLS